MRNKRILAISAIAISASVFMAACSFGGGNPDESVAVSVTPTPVATETPAPTATIAPNVQATTYTSADKSVAINLPNATWANKTDEADTLSFESPDEGKILILHGQGADTMAATVIPSTQDMATSLEQADGDKVDGTDFEIQDYTSTDVNGIGVYTYTTKMLNTEKSNGSLYVIHKVIANDSEYYSIEASVNKEDVLSAVKSSVDSFQILGDSSLKEAAPKQAAASTQTNTGNANAASSDANTNTAADSSAATDTSAAGTDSSVADTTGGTDSSSDGSESYDDSGSTTISNSAGFTDEQLSNTDETRTIYRNSDGHPLVITPDGNGSWVDFDGNTYNFTSDEDAYDENGTSYYWHGEGADVYYMPVQ
nr:hypothetical protein [uncultured Blautia sp.]